MKISTLSIGDELICGQVIDTNAGTISAALLIEGLRVQCHLTVGDIEQDIMGAIITLGRISDAIIVTGGLGPTVDDVTSMAAAHATGRRLVNNEEALRHVRQISSRLETLIFCPLNDKQAMIPTKSTLIPNPNGTACGFHLIHNGCFLFFLPGVPSEMTVMLRESVIPFILERVTGKKIIRTVKLNVFGPCEAEVDEILRGIARPDQKLSLGICVSYPWMQITLRAEADNEDSAGALLEPAANTIRERLNGYVFSAGDVDMKETVAALLLNRCLTIAVAESCSGGMIAKCFTDIRGSSEYFLEGLVTYCNDAKTRLLGVPPELIDTNGAVSSECASAMARGVRLASGSDIGLAVTGVAGPDGGSEDKPIGTVFISLAAPDGCWTRRFQFNGSRGGVRILTTWTALDWLRRYLLAASVRQSEPSSHHKDIALFP